VPPVSLPICLFPSNASFLRHFLLLFGIGVQVSILSLDSIGIGYSGFSSLEKTSTVHGIMLILVGFCITASSLIKRLTKFDKESETHE
jgi:hypothetical protein